MFVKILGNLKLLKYIIEKALQEELKLSIVAVVIVAI